MKILNWYSDKINKKVNEFDEFDKYITDVLKAWENSKEQKLNIQGVVKSFTCDVCYTETSNKKEDEGFT